jgi:hypothetical protein
MWSSWRAWGLVDLLPVGDTAAVLDEGLAYATPVFNYRRIGGEDDGLRGQLLLPDPRAPVASALARRARVALARRGIDAGGAVLLVSRAGCQQQAAHTDYDADTVDGLDRPEAYVVAIMDGTRLNVGEDLEAVDIPPGHVLWFDGTLVHAGAAYADDNVRIHFYGRVRPALEARDRTFLV